MTNPPPDRPVPNHAPFINLGKASNDAAQFGWEIAEIAKLRKHDPLTYFSALGTAVSLYIVEHNPPPDVQDKLRETLNSLFTLAVEQALKEVNKPGSTATSGPKPHDH